MVKISFQLCCILRVCHTSCFRVYYRLVTKKIFLFFKNKFIYVMR